MPPNSHKHTSISCSNVESSGRKGLTISEVTDRLGGRLWIFLIYKGLQPLRHWYPKNASSCQWAWTYPTRKMRDKKEKEIYTYSYLFLHLPLICFMYCKMHIICLPYQQLCSPFHWKGRMSQVPVGCPKMFFFQLNPLCSAHCELGWQKKQSDNIPLSISVQVT